MVVRVAWGLVVVPHRLYEKTQAKQVRVVCVIVYLLREKESHKPSLVVVPHWGNGSLVVVPHRGGAWGLVVVPYCVCTCIKTQANPMTVVCVISVF